MKQVAHSHVAIIPIPRYTFDMRTIFVDARFGDRVAGLGSYVRGLVSSLVTHDPATQWILLVSDVAALWLQALRSHPNVRLFQAHIPHYSLSEHYALPRIIARSNADIAFFPHFSVPLSCPIPYVCTLHDLTLHRFAADASIVRRLAYRIVVSRAVSRARCIMVPTNAVRDDLLHHFRSAADRVHVVPLGIDEHFRPSSPDAIASVRQKYHVSLPYFVYVGNRKAHKNVPLLLDAFHRSGLTSNTQLLLIAEPSTDDPPGVRTLSGVPPEDLAALYSGAIATVTATQAEGFCLPLLEALRCGCPVMCSDIPTTREVTGGYATLVDCSSDAFARALSEAYRISISGGVRLNADARSHAASFTWARAAQESLRLFDLVYPRG